TAIALCNNMAIFPSVIAEKLADIYLAGHLKPVAPSRKTVAEPLPQAVALSEKEALRYVGIYAHPESGRVFRLSFRDGKLINSGIFKNEIAVTPVSENRLLVVESNGMAELNPVFDKSGTISEIRALNKSGKPDIFVPVKPPFDSPQQLSEYAGTYYSDEFDADYKLTLQGNNLVLQIGENFEERLTAAYADYFTIRGGAVNLSFTRDDKGKIAGFVFNSAIDERDVKGIAFKRQ
ncbi:MAG TPA: hypothetical protein VGB68_20675, partial [Pyrinomonadaceae bacterium]